MATIVDQVVKAFVPDDLATGTGFISKDLDQDQMMVLVVFLGDAPLLLNGAFLLVAARVAKVGDDSRPWW